MTDRQTEYTAPAPKADGTLEVTFTYLEMRKPADPVPYQGPTIDNLTVLRAVEPTISFYRYLYNHVGGPCLWYERRALSDGQLKTILIDPGVHVYVLYANGVPAGYAELDTRGKNDIEVAYFGLLPEFIGRKLGPWFLNWTLQRAWSRNPARLWVNTCTLDHPVALTVYRHAGFTPFREETATIRDPRQEPFWQSSPHT
tara:strand:- start:75 stop:671 length:597 start_codon:yes stop_codon:yes gene_type:complete